MFDEAQKLKNPTSLMNTGAKAQQADFSIIMTGTPIENGVVDLWTMLDITWPGFFSLSAKEFVKRYGECDSTRREELKAKLVEPVEVKGGAAQPIKLQPIMLRRFKADILADLPERRIETIRVTMPEAQVRAYDAILGMMGERSMPALQALQALRTVSLHPDLTVPGDAGDQEAFVATSARVRALMHILDGVAERGEKILIFIDLLDAQRALSVVLAERYRLRRPPAVINGGTAGEARDRIRCDFQSRGPGFDVLLLGPKAAGFGLTLTAANHVVHLNRWWNPAVEDQCSDRVYRIGQKRPVTVWLPQAVHPRLGEKS